MKPGTPDTSKRSEVGALNDKENIRSVKGKNKSIDDVRGDLSHSSFKKNKRKSDILSGGGDDSKVTSTPFASKLKDQLVTPAGVDSIRKSTSAKKADKSILRKSASDDFNDSAAALGLDKPKKRNKSVSFMVEDGEVAGKKSKSSEETVSNADVRGKKYKNKKKSQISSTLAPQIDMNGSCEKNVEETQSENKHIDNKNKVKKKKDKMNVEIPDLTKSKKVKRQKLAESIGLNLENLSIGDNPNTLTSLLDEMQVVDKPKKNKKKNRNKAQLKNKAGDLTTANSTEKSDSGPGETSQPDEKVHKSKKTRRGKKKRTESVAEEAGDEVVAAKEERPKWHKRKWNKDRKTGPSAEELRTSVIVDNLPLSLLLSYRSQLSEHFSKYGTVKKIGIAECYPTEEPRPVFTTTVHFDSDEAATQALEEDNAAVCGARVRVRRPLPASQTTLAVRCYRGCSQQSMSSIFVPCGRIRSIREIQKGSAAIPTAFVEFDGPEAVERALKVAADAKIGGKKVMASRFEVRSKGHKRKRQTSEGGDGGKESDQDASGS